MPPRTAGARKTYQALRLGLLGVIAILVIQLVIGMVVNLFTTLPTKHPGTGESFAPSIPWALQGGAGLGLSVHVAIAILLVLGSAGLLVRALMSRRAAFILGASVGMILVLYAFSNGLNFLNRGGDDQDSFRMAVASILALVTYAATFYITREH